METIQRTKPIKVTSNYDFFYQWLNIANFNFKLTEAEMKFLASLLTERHELSKVILDPVILDQVLFSKETKDKIVEKLQLKTAQDFENKASGLRKKGIILDNNRMNLLFIPKVDKDLKKYSTVFTIIKVDEQG